MRREVEAKFKLQDENEIESAVSRLFNLGFTEKPLRNEIDFVPDTPDWACRKHGIILRFRRITNADANSFVLLTLKEKRTLGTFQDYDETEFEFHRVDMESWQYINARLSAVTGIPLPDSVLAIRDFARVVAAIRRAGYLRHRILLEKRRREFSLVVDRVNVTIDSFPDGMGTYAEIEAHEPAMIHAYIQKLKLTDFEPERLDYGDILKRHKQGKSEIQMRTAVFDRDVRKQILGEP